MTLQMTFRQLLMVAAVAASGAAYAQTSTHVEVFKSPYCGCCKEWVEHMRKAGFDVTTQNVTDVPAARKATGMPESLGPVIPPKLAAMPLRAMFLLQMFSAFLKKSPKPSALLSPGCPKALRVWRLITRSRMTPYSSCLTVATRFLPSTEFIIRRLT